MATFVLVHGAWHDGSSWNSVMKYLREKGHTAFAPTMPGHGKGVYKQVSQAQCAQSIVNYMVSNDITNAILLGHSIAGPIIAKVAEAIPERIRRLIFLSAFVLNDGESIHDVLPQDSRAAFSELASASTDNTVSLPFSYWRESFVNDGNYELARWSYEQLSPEPYHMIVDKVELKKFYSLEIPKSYLNCTEDTALPQGEWGWHPRMSSRLGLFRFVQMPGGHEVVFTNPIGLAEKIVEAGRD